MQPSDFYSRKKKQLCTSDDCVKAMSKPGYLERLASVEDEYLSLPSVSQIIGDYFADSSNSLDKLDEKDMMHAADLFVAVKHMNYDRLKYEDTLHDLKGTAGIYRRIECLQTNPLPPKPASKVQGKAKAKAGLAKKPLKK
jgi:hypothetical protein